jgi:Fic family protein
MKIYNWQMPDWPNFKYNVDSLYEQLLLISEKSGLIKGKLAHLEKKLQTEALINLLVEEAIKTSQIEGEYISRPDVRSSIKNKLGLNKTTLPVHDMRAQGIVEMMFDVRDSFQEPLSDITLFNWHLMLLSGVRNPNLKIATWRTHEEPMQIISGPYGKQIVHYEAPPSKVIPKEMISYIQWFNDTAPGAAKAIKSPPIRAAIAHLYFESIHPFEDGNGRVGRAIAEKALSQGFGYPIFFSLSQAIEANKKEYYAALHKGSRSNEISEWMAYFVNTILNAQIEVENQINFILKKSRFFDKYENNLNERQLKAIKRMLKAGTKGFEGGMTANKYIKISDTSKATATRDLQELVSMGIFSPVGSGRSARYELILA